MLQSCSDVGSYRVLRQEHEMPGCSGGYEAFAVCQDFMLLCSVAQDLQNRFVAAGVGSYCGAGRGAWRM